MANVRAEIIEAFRKQQKGCVQLGSEMYGALLGRMVADLEVGGVMSEIVADWVGDPWRHYIPLRLLAGIHQLVLAGEAEQLAKFYPSMNGRFLIEPAWEGMHQLLVERREEMRSFLDQQVQTNEVRRSIILVAGFLQIAAVTKRPFRLLEIGASAGLNLNWDRYRYQTVDQRWGWGKIDAPLRLETEWRGFFPTYKGEIEIVSRAGCDLFPIDISRREEQLRLQSFIWADQSERLARLRQAIEIGVAHPVEIQQRGASEWLKEKLAVAPLGITTVLFHSVVWPYIPDKEQREIERLFVTFGEEATEERPFAYLRLEGEEGATYPSLRLTIWPSGEETVLAEADWHGAFVAWLL